MATRAAMPGWEPLPPASGSYGALYPKGWFVYRGFTADLAVKFFSPIVRENVRETSLPVALFEFAVANPTARRLDVAVLFTFPNAAAHSAQLRTGFLSSAQAEPERKLVGVVLDARDERNPPTTQDSEWCLAVRAEHGGEVSYATSWNALASGGDILGEFAAEGRLPDKPLDATASAAAVAFHATLEPKASITVPFALSWDFPRVAFGAGPPSPGTQWWRRYTEYFGRSANSSFAIAREALLRHDEWEAAVDAWMRPILEEPDYPEWLKQAAFNELYYESFGGAFWEAGCITAPDEFRKLHPEDHKHFLLACPTEPRCAPLALRFAAQRARLALWPQIERDVLRAYADLIDATTPFVHDLGAPDGNPFFEAAGPPDAAREAKDLPALFILQVYACYRATQDRDFLAYVWSACKKCFGALRAADTYGHGLPGHNGDDTVTSPCPLHGVSLLGGGLCVAALEALERLAAACDDRDAEAIRRLVPVARANLDRQLWRPRLGYYAVDTHSRQPDALAAGALSGIRFAQGAGLPPILPAERLQQHLRQVYLRCVKPLRDSTGDGVADVGALNVVGSDRCPPGVGRCHEVSVADSYRLAATMYHVGRERQDGDLVADALRTAFGIYYQTWAVAADKPLWAFETPQAWDAAYPARARATQHIEGRAVWDLLLEIKDPYARPPEAPPKAEARPPAEEE
ncbi:MAG TPA: GH116 family glycosyl-hydrolase [Planctomycetota bacterium]|nr:GH116 family glycosyl-hydrolase [Planctomycetota bacterium]